MQTPNLMSFTFENNGHPNIHRYQVLNYYETISNDAIATIILTIINKDRAICLIINYHFIRCFKLDQIIFQDFSILLTQFNVI